MSKIRGITAAVLLSASALTGGFTPASQAGNFNVLHAFAGSPGDGDRSMAGVTFDQAGNLYGTTYDGGASDSGAIFKIDTHGTETLLHSFDGSSGGAYPLAGVTLDQATGDLYGLTQGGGASSCDCGVLYKLAADGTFTVLHAFTAIGRDGAGPQRQLLRDKAGNLYGVTQGGGSKAGYGTVFRYSKKGAFATLHSFKASSADPTGGVVQDNDGNLYGVTGGGGKSTNCSGHGCGTIFELAPDRTFVTLYSFQDGNDGRYPVGGLTIDKEGNLYGTTGYGGSGGAGTVFVMSASRKFGTLFGFNGANGDSPLGQLLLLKNDLYATAYDAGAGNLGTVIRISLTGVGKVLHNFTEDEGGLPIGGMVERNSVLYGTTSSGGADGYGSVFSLKIN